MAALVDATGGSDRLDAAKAFYDARLPQAGTLALFEHPSGGRVYGAGGAPNITRCWVLITGKRQRSATDRCSLSGFDTRAEAEAFDAKALALGGTSEGAPASAARTGIPATYFRSRRKQALRL